MDHNEILKYAKALYKYGQTFDKLKNDLEIAFPELRKSDDEKIRKSLLKWLQSNSYTSIAGIQINDVIDWLERQG